MTNLNNLYRHTCVLSDVDYFLFFHSFSVSEHNMFTSSRDTEAIIAVFLGISLLHSLVGTLYSCLQIIFL